jgi:iron complex transport system permease protein
MSRTRGVLAVLVAAMIVAALASIRFGALDFSWRQMASASAALLSGRTGATLDERIFAELRVPRALLCLFVGASLGVGGTLMQALFRNPIVEPGLVGTSSGAAFGAALFFVLGSALGFEASPWALPIAACAGGVLAPGGVFGLVLGGPGGRASVAALLLTGLAVNALALSGIGFLTYIARDPQARSIAFWNLGTLSAANWQMVEVVGASTIVGTVLAMRYAKPLNALLIVGMVAIATAFTGVIGFVGLIVPHILRMIGGADNRYLIPASALLGGTLLTLADLVARVALRPAELPIGIVTSVVGVPVFLSLLRRGRYVF